MERIVSRNPISGENVFDRPSTLNPELETIFGAAQLAQKEWAAQSLSFRSKKLIQLRESIIDQMDLIITEIGKETGKPKTEILTHELIPTISSLTYFAKTGARFLREKTIRPSNLLLLNRRSRVNFEPLGVVLIISPWNFPFYLPFGEIIMAVLSGNAVVFKPSEFTPHVGSIIIRLLEETGFPKNLVSMIIGDGQTGAAAIDCRPDKIYFTGSVATGRKISEHAGKYMIPTCLELGGKDALIITKDADLEHASSGALWGAFANAGQMCASTERILVHSDNLNRFLNLYLGKIKKLRLNPSDSTQTDQGAIITENQKNIYESLIEDAIAKNATILTGGSFNKDRSLLEPTVILPPKGVGTKGIRIFKEEAFGPLVTIETFDRPDEALEKANSTEFGLTTSVFTKDVGRGLEMAKKLESGTVTINDVAFTAGLPEAPWVGHKNSGTGIKNSLYGLLGFVKIKHINSPRPGFPQMKPLWWYPYTPNQYESLYLLAKLHSRSWFTKLRIFPLFLFHLVQFFKNERRL